MATAVEIKNLTVSYGSLNAVSNLTAFIPSRQTTAIIGPNGSGKSTLLKAILGLLPVQTGSVKIMGRPFAQVKGAVAYVPQKDEVDWHYPLLVREAIAMGRYRHQKILQFLNEQDQRIIDESLESMGLTYLAKRPIGQLSGGQKQRVFLARALAQEADLYLLDEPFNGVDANTEKIIREYIQHLKKTGKTIIVVHHKLNEVHRYFDHTMIINRFLIDYGPTKDVFRKKIIQKVYFNNLPLTEETGEEDKCLTYSSY